MFKLDWKRIKRTAIQAGIGAVTGLVTMIGTDFSKDGIIFAVVQFGVTILSAVCMNIDTQLKDMNFEGIPVTDPERTEGYGNDNE